MITLDDYYMDGRDSRYRGELTEAIQANARVTVERWNALLERAAADGVEPAVDAVTGTPVASGWRPRSVNDSTRNAAAHSRHLTAQACDLRDTSERHLARWCLAHPEALRTIGLWMEDPRWTPTWVHLQTVPPASQRLVYIPSSRPPLAAPLPEQALA